MIPRLARHAAEPSDLTPEQKRKIRQIEAALGKSDHALRDHFISLDTFGRSARKAKTGRVSTGWPETVAKLRAELLRARVRLDRLETGLRAQSRLHASLTELVAGVEAWHRGLVSTRAGEVESARASMRRHFAAADELAKRGLADLKRGR